MNLLKFGSEETAYDLSIIVPIYNVNAYVEHCLASLTAQVGTHELILIDDGSTDNSRNIALDFIERHKDLISGTFIFQNNNGLGAARNAGISVAKGRYITFVDSDDFVVPNCYQQGLTLAHNFNADILIFRAKSFDNETLDEWPFNDSDNWDTFLGDDLFKVTNLKQTPDLLIFEPSSCIRLYNRNFFCKYKFAFPEGLLFEDVVLHVVGLIEACTVCLFNKSFYYYRTNRIGKITETKSIMRFDILKIAKLAYDVVLERSPNNVFFSRLLHLIVRMGFWCARNVIGNERQRFFLGMREFINNVPDDTVLYYLRDTSLPFQQRYICYLILKNKFSTFYRLTGDGVNKISVAWFLLNNDGLRHLIKQIRMRLGKKNDTRCESLITCLEDHGFNAQDQSDALDKYENNYYKHEYALVEKGEIIVIANPENDLVFALIMSNDYWFARLFLIYRDVHSVAAEHAKQLIGKLGIDNIEVYGDKDIANKILDEYSIAWMLFNTPENSDAETIRLLSARTIRAVSGFLSYRDIQVQDIRSILEDRGIDYYFQTELGPIVSTIQRGGSSSVDVSVVLPVYNVEKYLPQCLDSLVSQQGVRLEILVIDDESTDNSALIATQYSKMYPTVKVLSKKNGGCASARTYGLKHARGKYVAFVDSDDWIDAGMYADLLRRIEESNADVAISGFRKVYEIDGITSEVNEIVACDMGCCNGTVNNNDQLFWLQPAIWRSLYNREFLISNELYFPEKIRRFDDLYFAFLVYTKARKVIYSPHAYYNYRLGRVGQDVTSNDERLYVHFLIFDLIREVISSEGCVRDEFRLKLVEIAAHTWALQKISPRLKLNYLIKSSLNFSKTVFIRGYNIPRHAMKYFGIRYMLYSGVFICLGNALRFIGLGKRLGM